MLGRILSLVIFFISMDLYAQSVLPKNIGLIQIRHREYSPQSEAYNRYGEKESLAKSFNAGLDGPSILRSDTENEMKQLVEEIKKFDGNSEAKNSLIGAINFGQVKGSVEADIQAETLGIGYGLTKKTTFFIGVPFISASVTSNISFTPGSVNVSQIKQALGEAAYDELKDGLDTVGNLNLETLLNTIYDKGYGNIDRWQHEGIGDIQLGFINANRLFYSDNAHIVSKASLSLPTGYKDDPSLLNDVPFGKDYASLSLDLNPSLKVGYGFALGLHSGLSLNLPTQTERRLAESNESLPDSDRLTTVDMQPGNDYRLGGEVSHSYGVFTSSYKLLRSTHLKDKYTGDRDGNYELLSKDSDSDKLSGVLGLSVNTASLFAENRFPVPFITTLDIHKTIAGVNTLDDTYFELSFATFFSTKSSSTNSKKKSRSKKSRTKRYSSR